MRRARVGSVVAMAAVLLTTLSSSGVRADDATIEQQAPFDHGCLLALPCDPAWEPARGGELQGSIAPWVCFVYGPPFVLPCTTHAGSSAGTSFRTTAWSKISVTARVLGTPAVSPDPLPTRACLNLRYPNGGGYGSYGCRAIRAGVASEISSTFESAVLPPGRYIAYVGLSSGPGAVRLERISISLRPVGAS